MKRNRTTKIKPMLTWALIMVVFLIITQVLFTIPAPCKWLDAVWEAGDLISFIGTVTLGIVAWQQSRTANEISRRLINLQAAEYIPVITLPGFVGMTNFGAKTLSDDISTDISIYEMHTKDNEIILGYALNVLDDTFNSDAEVHCHIYELHFRYLSKTVISSPMIKSIHFVQQDFSKTYDVNKIFDMSLMNEQEFRFFITFLSNSDFMCPNSTSNKLVNASKMIINLEFQSLTHKKYLETLTINKHLVINPDKEFKTGNTERLISSSYDVIEDAEQ